MRIQPKKSLGQNFLVDRNIRAKIIEASRLSKDDVVLEIGSGRGELTGLIAPRVKKVYCVEIDKMLLPELRAAVSEYSNIKIINADILKFDIKKEIRPLKKLKVIGNIPYYISSPILELLFKAGALVKEAYLTVQKEFGVRVCADSGSKDFGVLSCFAQYNSHPKIEFVIKKGSFLPIPKVDSVFLKLAIRDKPLLNKKDEKAFFSIVRAAFNQRRKTLRNSLKKVMSPQGLQELFERHSFDPNIRPEEISFQEFLNIAKSVKLAK